MLIATQYEGFNPSSGMGDISYGELALMAPSLVDLSPCMGVAWLFPDNLMALFAGREIYGFPKMYGHTVLDRHRGARGRGRVALRTQWGTAVDLPYRSWSFPDLDEDGLRQDWEALHEAVPLLTEAQKEVDTLLPAGVLPPEQRTPAKAWPMLFESVRFDESSRRSVVDALKDWLYVDLAGWKRLYDCTTKSADGPTWSAKQFLADRIVASRIQPQSFSVDSMALLQVDDTNIFPPEGRSRQPLLRILPELLPGRFGMYYEFSAQMQAGPGALVEYRKGPRSGPRPDILDWGPDIWRKYGWLDC